MTDVIAADARDAAGHAGVRTTARRSAHKTLLLFLIAGAQLMVVLDSTIVNIALPSMGHYFDKSQTDMTWAINAYTLAFGGLLLLGGRAADILGRRQMFILGLGLFSLGSLVACLANSFDLLLVGRVARRWCRASRRPRSLRVPLTDRDLAHADLRQPTPRRLLRRHADHRRSTVRDVLLPDLLRPGRHGLQLAQVGRGLLTVQPD